MGDKFDKWAYNGPKILPSNKHDAPGAAAAAKKKKVGKDVIDLDSASDDESGLKKKLGTNKNI